MLQKKNPTTDYLVATGIKGEKTWCGHPPSSPELSPNENLSNILKKKIYEGGRQYTSKQQLWEAVLQPPTEIQAETIHGLTRLMDERLFKVFSKKGSLINMHI